jgi:hypothetical protein
VLVVGSDRNSAEREQEWSRLMQAVQSLPQSTMISEADIAAEVDAARAAR